MQRYRDPLPARVRYDREPDDDVNYQPKPKRTSTMKTRVELMNIACMTSAEVVGVLCTFELPNRNSPRPKHYLYKCPRDLAETLVAGDLLLAEYEGTQASNRDRPMTVVIFQRLEDAFDPEDMTMPHRWVFDRVNRDRIEALKSWENATTNSLVQSQRRRAREAVLREVVGEVGNRPTFPALAAPAAPSNAGLSDVIDQEDQTSGDDFEGLSTHEGD